MAAIQQTFTSNLTWTLAHTWGTIHPYVVVVDSNGDTRLVAPDYSNNSVSVTFGSPIAGTLTLIGPDDSGTITLPPPSASQAVGAFANAVLVEIRQPGPVDQYGQITATLGDPLWIGQAPGYLSRAKAAGNVDGSATERLTDTFWIRDLAGVPVIEEPGARWKGSVVTIDDLRTGTTVRRRFTVGTFEHRAAGTDVDNAKIGLFAERTT